MSSFWSCLRHAPHRCHKIWLKMTVFKCLLNLIFFFAVPGILDKPVCKESPKVFTPSVTTSVDCKTTFPGILYEFLRQWVEMGMLQFFPPPKCTQLQYISKSFVWCSLCFVNPWSFLWIQNFYVHCEVLSIDSAADWSLWVWLHWEVILGSWNKCLQKIDPNTVFHESAWRTTVGLGSTCSKHSDLWLELSCLYSPISFSFW